MSDEEPPPDLEIAVGEEIATGEKLDMLKRYGQSESMRWMAPSPTRDPGRVLAIYRDAEARGLPPAREVRRAYPDVSPRTVSNAIREALKDPRDAGEIPPRSRGGRPRSV